MWLEELGLPQYARAFVKAGYDDQELLGALDESDLDIIQRHVGIEILPGHRKKMLMFRRGATAQV